MEAAGWPEQKGALTAVAKKVKVPHPTVSRWGRQVQNPPPNELVRDKRIQLTDLIENELQAIYAEFPKARQDASYRDLGVVGGILHDKLQLLTGGSTENVNHNVRMAWADDRDNTT